MNRSLPLFLTALLSLTLVAQAAASRGFATPVWSKHSCGISVVEFQEAAEALASLYIP